MNEPSRTFSKYEAEALIPKIEAALSHLTEKKEAYALRHDELFMHELLNEEEGHAADAMETEKLHQGIQEMEASIVELENEIRAIENLGCYVRNVEKGIVDIPTRKGEEVVYFCWQKGEKTLDFYHGAHEPMHNRRPVDFA